MRLETRQAESSTMEPDFKYYQTLVDTYRKPEDKSSCLNENKISCCITASERGICIEVEGYEENMSIFFEYYQGRLQVHVWGEKSLRNGGDLDTTVIITNDYEGFRKRIESS